MVARLVRPDMPLSPTAKAGGFGVTVRKKRKLEAMAPEGRGDRQFSVCSVCWTPIRRTKQVAVSPPT